MRVRVIFGSDKAWSSGGDDVDSLRSMGNFAARSKAPSAKTKEALCADLQRVNIVTFGSMGNELQQTLPVDGPVSRAALAIELKTLTSRLQGESQLPVNADVRGLDPNSRFQPDPVIRLHTQRRPHSVASFSCSRCLKF